jgi:hypothetical protein
MKASRFMFVLMFARCIRYQFMGNSSIQLVSEGEAGD